MSHQETQQPLLRDAQAPPKQPKTKTQKAIRKTFKRTASLSKNLPTGTLLVFQLLSPIFTQQGKCQSLVSQCLALALVALCSISCFLLSFTDSFRDERNKVRYGFATCKGLWVIDGSVKLSSSEAAKYKVKCIDFFHAFLSLIVFVVVAFFDQNIVKCFFPTPSEDAKKLLVALPIGIGVICGGLFVVFPSNRHGIGFPLSRN